MRYRKLAILVPLTWLLGFDFIFPAIIFAYGGFKFHKLNAFEKLVITLALWLVVSVTLSGSTDYGRIMSSLYAVFILIFVTLVHANFRSIFYKLSLDDILDFIRRIYLRVFLMCVAFAVFGLILGFVFDIYTLQFQTLLGFILPIDLPGIADRSMTAEIVRPDWGFGSFPVARPLIFSPWYTAGAMIAACTGLFVLSYVSQQKNGFSKEMIIEILLIFTILATLSRATLLMYFVGLLLASLIIWDVKRILVIILASFVGGIYLFWKIDLSDILGFRSYSTESRLTSYLLGIELALNESVLFGYGVKPRIDDLSIPIGSHSSWVSFLVRGGVVGMMLFVLWMYILPISNLLKKIPKIRKLPYKDRTISTGPLRFQLLVFGWVFLQEIDTAAIAITLLFISLALSNVIFDKLIERGGNHVSLPA